MIPGRPAFCFLVISLLFTAMFDSSLAGFAVAAAKPDAGAMQQMDYQRRLDQQRKADLEKRQAGGFPAAQQSTIGADYILLILLAASGAAFIMSRRSRKRHQARLIRRRAPRIAPPHSLPPR